MSFWTVIFSFLLGAHLMAATMHHEMGDRREVIRSLAYVAGCAVMMVGSVVAR